MSLTRGHVRTINEVGKEASQSLNRLSSNSLLE